MTVTWLGHACFQIEEAGYTVVLDPYTNVRGYPPLKLPCDEVLCTHQHFDHNYVNAAIPPVSGRISPFEIETVATFHDEKQGALRGANTVYILRSHGCSLVHLGDLGHRLTQEQAERMAHCDVLMIPVGGVYTIDAPAAKAVVEQLRPRIVVPMHYRHDPCGLENVAPAEEFLHLFPAEQVHYLSGSSFSPDGLSGVVVPRYPV